MATSYTSFLGLALPVTGELQGTWGDVVNDSITSLLDSAIAGTTTLSTDGDVTLTTTNGASNQAREAILLCSGARTALRTITAPAQSKIYTIINATTGGYAVKLVGAGPTTGLTIPNGASAVVAWNGSDFIEIGSSTIGNLTVNGNLSVTGTTTLTGAATLTANPTLSAGTANGVAYLNGSKVLTTGSALTFDGTNLGFGGTAQRITGDFSNATLANRVAFQTSTANGATRLNLLPNGTGVATEYLVFNSSDPTNSSFGSVRINASDFAFQSMQNGSGTYLPMTFHTGGSEKMRISDSGNVGIGTSSPASKLAVVGEARVYTGSNLGYWGVDGGNSYVYFGSNSSGYSLSFQTGGADRMRLDTSGNLGLGVTPSAWSGSKALQLQFGAISSGYNYSVEVSNNSYRDNANWRYLVTGQGSTLYEGIGAEHRFYTAPSGTAGNAISFTQAMTLDASGNLGVGTTSIVNNIGGGTTMNLGGLTTTEMVIQGSYQYINNAPFQLTFKNLYTGGSVLGSISAYLQGAVNSGALIFSTASGGTNAERARIDSSGNLLIGTTSNNNGYTVYANKASTNATSYALANNNGGWTISTASNELSFSQFNVGERARIDSSGNLLVGTTSAVYSTSYKIGVVGSGGIAIRVTDNPGNPMVFENSSGGLAGYIQVSGTTTSYVSISDYRLKENIQPMTGALAKVAALKPCTYKWKADGSDGEGFIAHELQDVVPDCVTGEKDAVDADGKPVYQGIDTSFLVATLTAAIQEQQAIINQLKARLDAANL